jgi:Mg2+ and Co2+ transporter CorA
MAARVSARWVQDGVLRCDGLESVPANPTGPVWIDVLEPDEGSLQRVSQRFPMPPLAIEDCLHDPQRPKLDPYHDQSFMIWLVPQMITGNGTPEASNVPRTIWYRTPGRSLTLPPRTRTMECSWRLCPTPGM